MQSLYSPGPACLPLAQQQQSRNEGNATVAPKKKIPYARALIQEIDVARAMDASGKNEDEDDVEGSR